MTYDQVTEILTAEELADANANGELWGECEAENYHLAHENLERLPEWTLGTYCGDLDHVREEAREAYELALDYAAREEWEKHCPSRWRDVQEAANNNDAVVSYDIVSDAYAIEIEYANGETREFTDPAEALAELGGKVAR
jgi:hypothetical protein